MTIRSRRSVDNEKKKGIHQDMIVAAEYCEKSIV